MAIVATWPSFTFAGDNVQGDGLSLPLALLRMGYFPEARANFPLNLMKLYWFICLFLNLLLAGVI